MRFEKYLNGFKEYLESGNFSDRTVETYGWCVKQFLAFVETYVESYINPTRIHLKIS